MVGAMHYIYIKYTGVDLMIRLYFKKLLSYILYTAIIFLFYIIAANILIILVNSIFKDENLRNLAILVITIVFLVIVVFKRRQNSSSKRPFYESLHEFDFKLKNDIFYIVKGMEWKAELFAFMTVLIPIFLALILEHVELTITYRIIRTILLFSIFVAIYIILNTAIWHFVHVKWHRLVKENNKDLNTSK